MAPITGKGGEGMKKTRYGPEHMDEMKNLLQDDEVTGTTPAGARAGSAHQASKIE